MAIPAWLVQVAISVAISAIAYLTAPKPKPEEIADLQNPTADASRPIPKIFGTVLIKGGNVLWYGDKHKHTWKVGAGQKKQEVTEYRVSVHLGLCLGPVDAITAIYVREKEAWAGEATAGTVIDVQNWDLFGGIRKEGGVDGLIYYLPGDEGQRLPTLLADRLGMHHDRCPAYRGISSVWFTGLKDIEGVRAIESYDWEDALMEGGFYSLTSYHLDQLPQPIGDSLSFAIDPFGITTATNEYVKGLFGLGGKKQQTLLEKGFYFGANSPYLPSTWVRARDIPKVLDQTLARIGDDANPAHIIYACLTDSEWGMGESPANVSTDSFNAVAQTLVEEGFGLSFLWERQEEIETFVETLISHIQGTLYVDPRTGLWTLSLLRDDYDANSLPHFDEDNSVVTSFQRRGFGEIVNEIVVEWTSPGNGDRVSTGLQDLAAVAAQGGAIVSEKRQYHGIRKESLAAVVLQRDLRSASQPLAAVDLTVDRTGWDLVPGKCIRLTAAEHDLAETIFRIVKVDYGRTSAGSIRLQLVEDVFGLEHSTYFATPQTQWQAVSEAPQDMAYHQPMTAPRYLAPQLTDTGAANVLCLLSAQTGRDTFEFVQAEKVVDSFGDETWAEVGERSCVRRGVLSEALLSEASSIWSLPIGLSPGDTVRPGNYLVIGSGSDSDLEIVLLRSFDILNNGTMQWRLDRGVMDTTPRAWDAGTQFWVIAPDMAFDDDTTRAIGSTVTYKLRSRTSRGLLATDNAIERTYVIEDRDARPLRPANVKVNGVGFGESDCRDDPDTLTVTWANRNRLTETGELLLWTDPGVTPEVGQTTRIEVYDINGDLANTLSGVAGETVEMDSYDFAGLGIARLRVLAERDGKLSLQGHEITVRRSNGGWDFSWGYAWGGSTS